PIQLARNRLSGWRDQIMRSKCLSAALTFGFATLLSFAATAQKSELQFTSAEETIIARNDALVRLRSSHPEIVRKVLDALASVKPRKRRDLRDPDPLRADLPFDPARNPDLVVYQRGSPEAAHDLFQLLKQAGTKPKN